MVKTQFNCIIRHVHTNNDQEFMFNKLQIFFHDHDIFHKHTYVDEEVYMTPPPGYCTLKKTPICHLHKLIYGPKLASHNFFFKLCSILFAEGFTQSRLITLSSNTFGVSLLLSYWFMLMTFF